MFGMVKGLPKSNPLDPQEQANSMTPKDTQDDLVKRCREAAPFFERGDLLLEAAGFIETFLSTPIPQASDRDAVLEEAANIADKTRESVRIGDGEYGGGRMNASTTIAAAIRALKSTQASDGITYQVVERHGIMGKPETQYFIANGQRFYTEEAALASFVAPPPSGKVTVTDEIFKAFIAGEASTPPGTKFTDSIKAGLQAALEAALSTPIQEGIKA